MAAGLGARDTLRLEAAMPLYGHELSEQINPIQAGLGWAVKAQQKDFLGRSALMAREMAEESCWLRMVLWLALMLEASTVEKVLESIASAFVRVDEAVDSAAVMAVLRVTSSASVVLTVAVSDVVALMER